MKFISSVMSVLGYIIFSALLSALAVDINAMVIGGIIGAGYGCYTIFKQTEEET